MTSQCHHGHTELALYPAGRQLLDQGVIEARDMTFESVITKTMWCLAHPEMTLQEWFNIDLAGEMTPLEAQPQQRVQLGILEAFLACPICHTGICPKVVDP